MTLVSLVATVGGYSLIAINRVEVVRKIDSNSIAESKLKFKHTISSSQNKIERNDNFITTPHNKYAAIDNCISCVQDIKNKLYSVSLSYEERLSILNSLVTKNDITSSVLILEVIKSIANGYNNQDERFLALTTALSQFTSPEVAIFLAKKIGDEFDTAVDSAENRQLYQAMLSAIHNTSEPMRVGEDLFLMYSNTYNAEQKRRILAIGQADFLTKLIVEQSYIVQADLLSIEVEQLIKSSDTRMVDAFISLNNKLDANTKESINIKSLAETWSSEYATDDVIGLIQERLVQYDLSPSDKELLVTMLKSNSSPLKESILSKMVEYNKA